RLSRSAGSPVCAAAAGVRVRASAPRARRGSRRLTRDTAHEPVRPRDLRIVAGAIAVSALGDWVAVLALAVRANEMWKGIGVSVIFIALWSPIAMLAGHAGLIVDRFETRTVAIVASLFQCAVVAVLAFATGSIVSILALTVLLGV